MGNDIKNKQDRLKQVFEYLKFKEKLGTQKKFSEKLERDNSNISQAFRGNKSYLTDDLLTHISSVFPDIDENWLLTGEGEMVNYPPTP